MSVIVTAVMRQIHNWFETGYRQKEYSITGGAFAPDDLLKPGMWVAIEGSFFHNGAWKLGEGLILTGLPEGTPDEVFEGKVWFLAPPADFLETCKNIAEFRKNTPNGGYQGESFGEYSYTRAGGKNGGILTWQQAFADDLAHHYHMFTEVNA